MTDDDFGTARLLSNGESHAQTTVMGTTPYMSAAALRGRQNQAADLYALGVTIHESLTEHGLHRRPPFWMVVHTFLAAD